MVGLQPLHEAIGQLVVACVMDTLPIPNDLHEFLRNIHPLVPEVVKMLGHEDGTPCKVGSAQGQSQN